MPSATIATIEKLDQRLARFVEIICVSLLAVIVSTICISVFTRFVIFYPLNFADALAKYLMQWMAFLGVGLAIRTGEHVLVDMFTTSLSARWRLNLYVFTNILMMGLFAAIIYFGSIYALSGWNSQDIFVFGVSMAVPYFSVPVGGGYALIATAFATWLAVAKSRVPQTNPDTGV
ncbi:MAG: TRAP-type C4-dicarboxylate transport system permease small subunit [Glaciecola sp.]|jgi:TRAP-type C4-dicarboxylate transport system permease small subunit|uniref:TRAP transporter small permease n=1 Tax=Sulfitobacter sp. TaxID=1903071 RepID=UPI0039E4750E